MSLKRKENRKGEERRRKRREEKRKEWKEEKGREGKTSLTYDKALEYWTICLS
jgi:hypothetical protein